MAGYIASLKDSLRTLLSWRMHDTAILPERTTSHPEAGCSLPKPPANGQASPSPAVLGRDEFVAVIPHHGAMTVESLAKALDATEMTAKAEESEMANKFVSVMEAVAKDFAKGLTFAVKYLPAGAKLAALIFPASAAADAMVVSATDLIQNAVVVVEQKYAASGMATGTGEQKLAEVLTLTEAAVTALLTKAGITADATYVTNIVDAVVAILNVQTAPAEAAA